MLATANAAGYRFSTSDQAFYVPAVLRALDPDTFPRDGAMLDVQSRLMVLDEALALVRRTTGLSLEAIFFGAYLLSIGVIWTGLVLIGQRVYRTAWATAALAAAFSMRHGIPRTGANSFEAYFHPRMLAFAIGLLAIAAVLRGRSWLGVALVGGAALAHITTGLWFAVLIGVALAILDRRMRTVALAGSVSVVAGVLWALATDRLASPLAPMDEIWLRALATKESLFATTWPPIAWAYNLGFLVLLWGAHLVRRARRRASDADTALVWGGTALVALFLLTLPFVASGLSLFVQLQIGRVFWLVDLLATIYVVGVLADGGGGGSNVEKLGRRAGHCVWPRTAAHRVAGHVHHVRRAP